MILGKVQDKDNWRFVFRFKKPLKIINCNNSIDFRINKIKILANNYKLVGTTWLKGNGVKRRYIYYNGTDLVYLNRHLDLEMI